MQLGGGAMGMIIVDDAPGMLPPDVANLEERHLVISDLRAPSLVNVAQRKERSCLRVAGEAGCREAFWTAEAAARLPQEAVLLVNGHHAPTMDIDAGSWYRLRLLFASAGGGAAEKGGGMMMGRRLAMMMSGTSDWSGADLRPRLGGCETLLLAKDGVYLPKAPRRIDFGHMSAGNRADWLVRCPAGTHAMADDESGATLVAFRASRTAAPPAPPIAPFAVTRLPKLERRRRAAPMQRPVAPVRGSHVEGAPAYR